ncbi:MAG TPA: hypothetical protein VE079_00240 [Ensifer sp.]|nr:hypothetical protein [Ensifer sp.]
MSDFVKTPAPLPELLKHSVEQFAISTDVTNVDVLLGGEASRHFPEPRNRRRDDVEADDIRRLRAMRDALKSGSAFPDEALEHENAPVLTEFYKQF